MNENIDVFEALRPRLLGIAYRMLGSHADAEDVVQDCFIRWQAARAGIGNDEAWLVSVVTRRSIDELRSARRRREEYVGPWLPEPVLADVVPPFADPEAESLQHDVSLAFLALLERLTPDERAAFLLRQVFDVEYAEIASMLGRSQAACRQLVSRARRRIADDRPRFRVNREVHRELLERFMNAARDADEKTLQALLADDATFTSDGGGKVVAAIRVLHGAERLCRLYRAIAVRGRSTSRIRLADINGEPAALQFDGDSLVGVTTIVTDGRRVLDILVVRNPDKLRRLANAVTSAGSISSLQ